MPTARRCSGCGATLNDPSDGASTITCRFCGLTHDLGGGAASTAATPIVVTLGRPAQRSVRTVVLAILSVVLLITGIGIYIALEATRGATRMVERLSTIPTTTQRPTTARERERLKPDALATITQFGWFDLDVPPPPGGFDAFEPVAALPWAMDIARGFASDAALTRIDVGRVDTTGVIDLDGESTTGYRFSSPGRLARWKQETDAGSRSQTRAGMMLQIQGTTVRALLEEGHNRADRPAPAPAKVLPLPELLARAKNGRNGVPDRPFYSGYMIHLPREGWVWYFSAPSGDSFPRARATDGRTYPY